MPPRRRVATDGDDSSAEEVSVDRVVETKAELEKIRKERDKKRAQLQVDLEERVNALHARVKQSVRKHTQQLGDIHLQQIGRLLQAIEDRDRILQAIVDNLSDVQAEAINLSAQLDGAYEYRMKKAESFALSASGQDAHHSEETRVEAT